MLPSQHTRDKCHTHRDSRSMSSDLDIASGRMRGIAATQVLNRSILGFLSPLLKKKALLTSILNCF